MKVTVTDFKPDGSPTYLHGKTAELIIHHYDSDFEVDWGLGYIASDNLTSKGYIIPLYKQFEEGKWLKAETFSFAKSMSDDDIEHWLTMLALKA